MPFSLGTAGLMPKLEFPAETVPATITSRSNVAKHQASHVLEATEHGTRPVVLLCLGIAAVLLEGRGHQFPVALAKGDAFLFGNAQHGRVDLPVGPRIRWMLDGLEVWLHQHRCRSLLVGGQ